MIEYYDIPERQEMRKKKKEKARFISFRCISNTDHKKLSYWTLVEFNSKKYLNIFNVLNRYILNLFNFFQS